MVAALPLLLEIIALSLDVVGDEGFDSGFGAAVGVCRADGADLGDGNHVFEAGGVAVDGSRGGEDYVGDIVPGGRREEADRAIDVCAIVLQGYLARLAYCLQLVNPDLTVPL